MFHQEDTTDNERENAIHIHDQYQSVATNPRKTQMGESADWMRTLKQLL